MRKRASTWRYTWAVHRAGFDPRDARRKLLRPRQPGKQRPRRHDQNLDAPMDQHPQRPNLVPHHPKRRRQILIRRQRAGRRIPRHTPRLPMKQPQRSLKIINRRIAGHNDGDPLLRRVLQRSQAQRPRLHRRPGNVDAAVGDALADRFERPSAREFRANPGGQGGGGRHGEGDSNATEPQRHPSSHDEPSQILAPHPGRISGTPVFVATRPSRRWLTRRRGSRRLF